MFKVRFHLAAGANYQKWQVTNLRTGEVEYHNPNDVHLIMRGCQLRNQRGAAEKIYAGANKQVCAWVECDEVAVIPAERHENLPRAVVARYGLQADYCYCLVHAYDPRTAPYWRTLPTLNDPTIVEGGSVDNHTFSDGYTVGRSVRELCQFPIAY